MKSKRRVDQYIKQIELNFLSELFYFDLFNLWIKLGFIKGTIVHAAKINFAYMGVWKCLFDLPERTFTATCLLDVTVLRIPEENLKKIINGADPFLKYCIGSWLSITRQFMGQKS